MSDLRSEVLDLLKDGVPQAEIASRLGVSQSTVSRIKRDTEKDLATSKAHGLKALLGKERALAAMRDEIHETYHAGGNVSELWRRYLIERDGATEGPKVWAAIYEDPGASEPWVVEW